MLNIKIIITFLSHIIFVILDLNIYIYECLKIIINLFILKSKYKIVKKLSV